jgi:hypothetical protein
MIFRNRSGRMMAAWLRRIASGTKIPGRVFDSADEPRPGARCNSCACATEARRAQIQRLRTGGKFPPGVILRAIDFRVPVK